MMQRTVVCRDRLRERFFDMAGAWAEDERNLCPFAKLVCLSITADLSTTVTSSCAEEGSISSFVRVIGVKSSLAFP